MYDNLPPLKAKDLKRRTTVQHGTAAQRQLLQARLSKQRADERLQKVLAKQNALKTQKVNMTHEQIEAFQQFQQQQADFQLF